MRSIGKVLPIPVGKQLKMCELSSRSRAQAATSAYIYHIQSPVPLFFSNKIPEILSRMMGGKGGRTATVSRPVLRRPSSLSAQDHPHP